MDAGIYAIYNTVNDKLYIGSAVSVRERCWDHKKHLRRGDHHSRHLQGAWNKYGSEAFEFGCLETADCKAALVDREQAWIDALGTANQAKGYNMSPTAGSPLGIRWTEEARRRVSKERQGRKQPLEAIEKTRLANTGKKRPAEVRAKISLTKKGQKPSVNTIEAVRLANTGKKHSALHRERIRLASTGRKNTAETLARMSLAAFKREAAKRAAAHCFPNRINSTGPPV